MTNNVIQQIKDRVDIVEEIGKHVELKPSGDRFLGFCPFHENVNTPAFTVYPDQGRWICYGCDERGDIFSFLQAIEGVSFRDLLRKYAKRFNITLKKITADTQALIEHDNKLLEVLAAATVEFQNTLTWYSSARQARAYLTDRGILPITLSQFNLGYAPDSWRDMVNTLTQQGHDEKLIIEAGLGKKKETGGLYNFFRNRLMFPIAINGETLGFGGRTMSNDPAKYLNSPTSTVFTKRKLLYGLPQARESIRKMGEVVLVEGYMDVIALHQSGFTNVVSIMGTTFSREHGKTLRSLTDRVILALDSDAAGKKAIMRVKIEEQSGLDLYIAALTDDRDPDEIVLANPNEWNQLISGAIAIPVYITDTLIAGAKNLDDPKTKSKIVNRVIRLLDYVGDPHEQAAYQEYLAKAVGYDSYRINTTCPHCKKKYHED